MGTLSYTATVSVDGYVADAHGGFDWSGPGDEVFALHVERMGEISAEVLGRRTHLLMRYWEHEPAEGWGEPEREFARRWQALEKVAVSATLSSDDVAPGTRLMPALTLPELQEIVDQAPGEVEVFGPTTAADAIRAGMVRDFRFFVVPRIVGGGLKALPEGADLALSLVEHRILDDRSAYLHYRAAAASSAEQPAPSAEQPR